MLVNWGLNLDDYMKLDGQYNVFNLYNKSKVFLLACRELPSDPLYERFGSMPITRGWIEEGGEVSEQAKANLWLSIGRWKNDTYNLKKKLLITANPKKGWLKREFIDPEKLESSKRFIQAFATDNHYLSRDYIKTLSETRDDVTRQRLFEGRWDYDEDKTSLISYDSLTDTFSNTIIPETTKYIVVDVARFGKDNTVITLWKGLELYKVIEYSKQDTQNTIQKIKDIAEIEQVPYSNIMIDEDGIGGAVVDGLFGVKGFIANSTPIETKASFDAKLRKEKGIRTNFRNLKSQCAFKLATLINEHKIKFSVPEHKDAIIEELDALLRNKNVDGDSKLQIKPKDEVKQIIGRSPDIGDPIIYRMWYELNKDSNPAFSPQQNKIIQIQNDRFERVKNNLQINSTK